MNIGKSLKLALVHRNMKQFHLAEKMQVSNAYISAIALNNKTISTRVLAHICETLNYKVSEFVALGE